MRRLLPCLILACGTPPSGRAPVPPAAPDARLDARVSPDAPPEGYAGLGAASLDPMLVAAHAPPPLAPEVSARIAAMLDARAAPTGALTQRADRLVFSWKITGTWQVWRVDGPRAFPVQLTGGEDHTTLAAISLDDRHLVLSRDRGGAENPALLWLPIEGGVPRTIFAAAGVQARLAFISDDAAWVYYFANDQALDRYDLYRWNAASGAREPIALPPGLWSLADRRARVAADPPPAPGADVTDVLLLSRALGNARNEIHALDLGTGALTPLLGVGAPTDAIEEYQAAFGARPGTLLVRTDVPSDRAAGYVFDGTRLTPWTDRALPEISAMAIDAARRRAYATVNDGGLRRTRAFDARTLAPLAWPAHPSLGAADNAVLAGLSRDGRFAQVIFDGARQVPTTAIWDWQRRTWTQWTLPSAPGLDVRAFAPVTIETYPARDGTPIPMLVRRPTACATAARPCPVVVQFHGGPEVQALPGFSPLAQLYVDAGFIFVEPNVRGSSGYGKAWLHADDGPKRLSVVTDIEDCARHLRAAWAQGGEAPRLGVTGRSYGGYSTLFAMGAFAGAYDVGVAEVAIASLPSFLANTAPYRRALRVSEYGDPERDAVALRALSPITYADQIVAPLLLLHGVNDPRVPVGEAVQMYERLRARGVPGGLILFADEGHGTATRANQVLAIGHTLAFFERHLQP